MAGNRNPYGRVKPKPGFAPGPLLGLVANPRYAVPDVTETTEPDYELGGAPVLRNSPQGTPSDIRMGTREPPANDPNNPAYLYQREADQILRASDQEWNTTPQDIRQGVKRPGIYPDQVQEKRPTRPTADDSPSDSYSFRRPWHRPRTVKEIYGPDAEAHFSLADHRRVYPVNTMVPRGRLGVNTYRADPQPWSENLINVGNEPTSRQDVGVLSSASGGNRAFRLM